MSRHTLDPPTEPLDDHRPDDVGAPPRELPDLSSILDRNKEPEPQPEEPAVNEALMSQARDLGFSDEDLEGIDQSRVERMIAAVDRRAIDAMNKIWSTNQPQSPAPAGMGAAPAGPQSPTGAPFPQQFKIDLDPNEYDDKLVATLNAMNQYWAQQFQALQAAAPAANVADDPTTRWFDAQFSGLGEDYVSVFGKGTVDELRPDSPEEKNRLELYRAFAALRDAFPTASDEVLFQRAMNASFGHVKEAAAAKALKAAAKKRQASTIGKPSGRQSVNTERDPWTGLSTNTIDTVQRAINAKLNR